MQRVTSEVVQASNQRRADEWRHQVSVVDTGIWRFAPDCGRWGTRSSMARRLQMHTHLQTGR